MDPGLERFRERLSQLAAIEGALAPHILRGASGWDGGRACAQCKAGREGTSRSYWGAPDTAYRVAWRSRNQAMALSACAARLGRLIRR